MRAPLPPASAVGRLVGDGLRTTVAGLDRADDRQPVERSVAAGVALLGVAGVAVSAATSQPVTLGVFGALVPLLVAIRRPLAGWRACWLVGVLAPLVPHESHLDLVQVGVEAVLFCAAAVRFGRPLVVAMWLLDVASVWVWSAGQWRPQVVVTVVLTLLAVAVDALVGWFRTRRDLDAQTALTRTEVERRAVLEERARIAREMHDIVAHHLSMIAVRTETAPYRLTTMSDDVRAELASLNTAAREALADTRSLLTTLRAGDGISTGADRAPQPTLAEVDELITNAQESGVRVRRSIATRDVRQALGACAYRIVQEGLSNAVRHAPGSIVDVTIDTGPEHLVVRVHNDAPGAPVDATTGGGQGLSGMRERVSMLGGTLAAGPTTDGGFEVAAQLPLRAAS